MNQPITPEEVAAELIAHDRKTAAAIAAKTKQKRNTHAIGFSEAEYKEIKQKAYAQGLYPRQYLLMKMRGNRA